MFLGTDRDSRSVPSRLPNGVGIGLKPHHVDGLLADTARVGFIEVHAENYMGDGGAPHAWLRRLRDSYSLSVHGVGLSIGGEAPIDAEHLSRLETLLRRYEPEAFSEHLAWSTHQSTFLSDLLPVAYDHLALARVTEHIQHVQEALGRRMLLENPSTYVAFNRSNWSETDFLNEVMRRTGCGLLLDVSNVCVSCTNHGMDPLAYVNAFSAEEIGEIHIAGYAVEADSAGAPLFIDSHDRAVSEVAWNLYRQVIRRFGARPTLVEWDNETPGLPELLMETDKALDVMRSEAHS